MTNGEKILNAFPSATVRIIEDKDFRYIEVEQDDKWIADFNVDWWHSEYKEPKTGHWIEKMDACECPYCHKAWDYYDNDTEDFDYCPKCGAKLSENPTDSKDVIWYSKSNHSEIVVEPQDGGDTE